MKYAVLVLGLLLIASSAQAEECGSYDSYECKRARESELRSLGEATRRSEAEYQAAYERSRPIQVITPDSSYLAYPSMDGRTVTIYDRTRY